MHGSPETPVIPQDARDEATHGSAVCNPACNPGDHLSQRTSVALVSSRVPAQAKLRRAQGSRWLLDEPAATQRRRYFTFQVTRYVPKDPARGSRVEGRFAPFLMSS